MQYRIATGRNVAELEVAVIKALGAGWRPMGGVCAWTDGSLLMQALVKE